MHSKLLQRKATGYKCPDCGHEQNHNESCDECGNCCGIDKTATPFYGPIPRGVGGADLDGIPDSPINNKTPEYAEESRGYKNPLAEKGTENKDEDANLVEGIPPGLIVAGVDIHESPTKLPPRNDLRRHLDKDALEEDEEPEMRHLISCLVVAEKEI
jgi:hypothetical protein